ncbi:hypothetical protein IFR04_007685 [Cadophora malorum]|uniref:Uncharacterized protein n=1 Tax=Cadophora malorum TaxID=108018 RepID=A0A8H7TG93_9HELO|nr:hypothetical protein IFR04_007685 [Cadophora malorum]
MSAKALGFKQCGGICTASMGRVPGECAGECGSDNHHEDHALLREMYEKIRWWIEKAEMTPQNSKDMGVVGVKSFEELWS